MSPKSAHGCCSVQPQRRCFGIWSCCISNTFRILIERMLIAGKLKGRLNTLFMVLPPQKKKSWTPDKSLFRRSVQAGFCMRQDSAFSISNCNAPGCSNPYSHLSASSIRPPSILLRYRNTPSSTPQRSFPSVHCPNSSPFATCFEPWNVGQAIPYTPPYGTAHLGPNEASFLVSVRRGAAFSRFPSPFRCRLCGSWRRRRSRG